MNFAAITIWVRTCACFHWMVQNFGGQYAVRAIRLPYQYGSAVMICRGEDQVLLTQGVN
ncbi:MAG: hypothetical protein ACREQ4_01095 [Candidatus Binataceae bacterium]